MTKGGKFYFANVRSLRAGPSYAYLARRSAVIAHGHDLLGWPDALTSVTSKVLKANHHPDLDMMAQLNAQLKGLLVEAHKLTTSREMLLWMAPSEAPKALHASARSELLGPMRASCWISTQH